MSRSGPPPGASQFTEYADGGDQIVTMKPRRNVPPPSQFTVTFDELPKAEQERLRGLERGIKRPNLERFKCKYFDTCKFAFATEERKVVHELHCLEEQKRGQEQHKDGKAIPLDALPVANGGTAVQVADGADAIPFVIPDALTKADVVEIVKAEVAPMFDAIMSAIRGKSQPGEGGGDPRGSRSDAYRENAQEDRPPFVPSVGPSYWPLGSVSPESSPPPASP